MISENKFLELVLLCRDGLISQDELAKLQPYKVDNAIIMAAGLASRFAPLSYEKPKALFKVRGEVLIERQIRQLQAVGITDITIVVGYKKEKFLYLENKFGVEIVVNDDYYRYNNTSTLFRVLNKLRNSYICSSDNYFTENVFEPYVYRSYYAATYFPGRAAEWGLKCDKSGLITGIDHAPTNRWCMMGHVYFSSEFSRRFVRILLSEYDKVETRTGLWECLYERQMNRLPLYVRRYRQGVVREFDSLEDLRRFDVSYVNHSGSRILKGICRRLSCEEREIERIAVVRSDEKNMVFSFECKGVSYVYNHVTKSISKGLR